MGDEVGAVGVVEVEGGATAHWTVGAEHVSVVSKHVVGWVYYHLALALERKRRKTIDWVDVHAHGSVTDGFLGEEPSYS
jgi:hypothetical protein